MASTNLKTAKSTKTPRTHEGAIAKKIPAEMELRRSVLSCLLWEKEFYESGEDIATRIGNLIPKIDAGVVAQIAVEARTIMNLRHIPLLIVRIMASLQTHKHLVADTLTKVILRPDELTEFLSIYWKDGKKPLAKQVKVGLGKAFAKFDEFTLAKYNTPGKTVKLRDVLRICRPIPQNQEQSALWKRVIKNELAVPDTWEREMTDSKDKKASWTRLLSEKRLGALAFLRNLRNMSECKVDQEIIRQYALSVDVSKVLPFRFIAAARYAPWLEPELEAALFKNTKSLPKLKGKTVVLVDVSSSMNVPLSSKSDMTRKDAACGLAMILREICESVTVFAFDDTVHEVPSRRGFALRDAICKWNGCTYLGKAVAHANSVGYDRLIVFTDEQTADTVPNPTNRGYMINVASAKNGVGYGPWTHFDGFSESIVSFIAKSEEPES